MKEPLGTPINENREAYPACRPASIFMLCNKSGVIYVIICDSVESCSAAASQQEFTVGVSVPPNHRVAETVVEKNTLSYMRRLIKPLKPGSFIRISLRTLESY